MTVGAHAVTDGYRDLVSRRSQADLLFAVQVRADLASGRARKTRLAAGVKLMEMAPLLGVTPQVISLWERGKRKPTLEHAVQYGRLLAKLITVAGHAPAA